MQPTTPPPPPDVYHSEVTLRVNGEPRALTVDHRTTLLDALREGLDLTGAKKGCDHGQCGACTVLVDGRRANSCLLLAVTLDGSDVTTVEGIAKDGPARPAAEDAPRHGTAPEDAPQHGAPQGGSDPDGSDPDGSDADGGGGGPRLHPLQRAFLDRDAFQCGYCTPGQLCSALGMLAEAAAGHPSLATDPDAPPAQGPVRLTPDEIRERMSGNLCRCGAYPNIVQAVEDVIR
ncbi:(2Fe-2S)-binding protein [Streptomyces sp. enrichment culture]|uniref:(2Fe-2S)-binding protein n=1 Tax=Streptomyces sp. enrichment culture TaxID=1795815 RepID=UPI003F544385